MPVKIPKNQKLWLSVYDANSNLKYIITSDYARTKYNRYNINKDGSLTKAGTAINPKELERLL